MFLFNVQCDTEIYKLYDLPLFLQIQVHFASLKKLCRQSNTLSKIKRSESCTKIETKSTIQISKFFMVFVGNCFKFSSNKQPKKAGCRYNFGSHGPFIPIQPRRFDDA